MGNACRLQPHGVVQGLQKGVTQGVPTGCACMVWGTALVCGKAVLCDHRAWRSENLLAACHGA